MDQHQLVGTWQLVSCTLEGSDGSISYPFGRDAIGYMMYLPDGYMGWGMMEAHRAPFASPEPLDGTDQEKIAAYGTYFSYFGRYILQGGHIRFPVLVSLFPNWTNTEQERFIVLTGERLHIWTHPMTIHGKTVTGHFRFVHV